MFFIFSKILDFLVNPLTLVITCMLIGLLLKKEKPKKRFLLAGFSLLLFFSNPWIINRVLLLWEVRPIAAESITQPYDIGIVLGGSTRYYDTAVNRVVYGNSVDRLLQAIDLYRKGKIKKIMLSGGSGFVLFPEWKEAGHLRDVLIASHIPDSAIIIENDSRNTFENATASAKILRSANYGKRILLITSCTHMRRSLACFAKAGIAVDPFAVDRRSGTGIYTPDKLIEPDSDNINSWNLVIHEWVGMIIYKILGYI